MDYVADATARAPETTPQEALELASRHLSRLMGQNATHYCVRDHLRGRNGLHASEWAPIALAMQDAFSDAHGEHRLHRCTHGRTVETFEEMMADQETCEHCSGESLRVPGVATQEISDLDLESVAWRALGIARLLFIAAGKQPYAEELMSILDGGDELLNQQLLDALQGSWRSVTVAEQIAKDKEEGIGRPFVERKLAEEGLDAIAWEGYSREGTERALHDFSARYGQDVEYDYLVRSDGQSVVPTNLRSLLADDGLDDEVVLRGMVGVRLGEGYEPGKRVGW